MSYRANRALILGIDSGRNSGWGIFAGDIWKAGGVAKTPKQRREVVDLARSMTSKNYPLIVGREVWTPGWSEEDRSFKTILGIGASWGRWEQILGEYGFPEGRIFTVYPNTWRKQILSLRAGKYSREEAKRYAIAYCKAKKWYIEGDIDHDHAEGTLVAYYFVYNDDVAEAIKNPGRMKLV